MGEVLKPRVILATFLQLLIFKTFSKFLFFKYAFIVNQKLTQKFSIKFALDTPKVFYKAFQGLLLYMYILLI